VKDVLANSLRGMSTGKCLAVFAWGNILGIFHPENVRAELSKMEVRISVQDYKCRPAVMFWATLISTQAHTHTHKDTAFDL